MLDATKYMNRLRLIVLGVDELVYMNKSEQLDYLLNRVKDELEEIAQVDQEPSLEGRQLLMVLSPLKK